MAYPAVRSVSSSATDTDGSSIVATHPSGLTAGDLMILLVGIFNGGARTITTPSGWTVEHSANDENRFRFAVYKKVATSGDVSAGSTTVSFSGTVDKSAFGMYAITGAAAGVEITLSEVDSQIGNVNSTTITDTTAITPLTSESLVISSYYVRDFELSATLTASSFSLTPTTTLTERIDVGVRDASSDGFSLFSASGEYAGTSQITSRSVTVSEAPVFGTCLSVLLLVNAIQNAIADVAHQAITPTQFGVTASVNVALDIAHQNIPVTQNGIATVAKQPTQWQNETKPSTNWNNDTL
jgi:hypothetical protein